MSGECVKCHGELPERAERCLRCGWPTLYGFDKRQAQIDRGELPVQAPRPADRWYDDLGFKLYVVFIAVIAIASLLGYVTFDCTNDPGPVSC